AKPSHVLRRSLCVLGPDPQRGRPRLRPVQGRRLGDCDDQPAGPEAQVEQLVVAAWRLPQLVLARKAQVCRAVIDVCRNIGRFDKDHAEPVLLDQQLAPDLLLVQVGGARPAQDLQAAVQKEAGGNGDGDQSASLPPPPAPPGTPPTSPPREAGFAGTPGRGEPPPPAPPGTPPTSRGRVARRSTTWSVGSLRTRPLAAAQAVRPEPFRCRR